MKLPNFFPLRRAIANLDVRFIARKIAELESNLLGQGKILEPENTALTEEGIYYIEPESGMTTKVVLYQADHEINRAVLPQNFYLDDVYTDKKIVEKFHRYHLVRCNFLVNEKLQGWTNGPRITQRPQGDFYYRFVSLGPKRAVEILKEIEKQPLFVCPNCYFKVTSLIDGADSLAKENFAPQQFFDIESAGSWCRYDPRSDDMRQFADLYPKDWADIAAIRMRQVAYHCESCNRDFSGHNPEKFLTINHTDHIKHRIGYVRLECLCNDCMAQRPISQTSAASQTVYSVCQK